MTHISGTINPAKILEVLISSGSTGGMAFFSGLQQAVENAFDAGASRFDITIDKKNNLTLSDNGKGFRNEDIISFFSLYVSSKVDAKGLIGKNGSGRIFLLQIAERLNVYTKSKIVPNIVNFSLARKDLEPLLMGKNPNQQVLSVNKPRWWGNKETGTSIVLEGVDWSRIPSQKKIIESFSAFLAPSIARMVRVNGKPLHPRAVVGEVIRETFHIDGIAQPIDVELFIPEKSRQGESIVLGAFNPIMGIREFMRVCPKPVPAELMMGGICGNIFIPDLNPFSAHDRRSFDDNFYQSELLQKVIFFFEEELAPIIKEAFARKKKDEDQAREEQALSDISSLLRDAYGKPALNLPGNNGADTPLSVVTKPLIVPKLILDPSRATLCPGESIQLKIRGAHSRSNFDWEINGDNGSLSGKKGSVVHYTANKVGKDKITVTEKGTGLKGTTSITIVAEDAISISPRHVEIEVGRKRTFSVRTKKTNFTPFWDIPGELKFEQLSGNRVSVIADTPGKYNIQILDPNTEGVLAKATIIATPESKEVANVISLDGKEYLLEVSDVPIPGVVEYMPGGKINPLSNGSTTIDVLKVDMSHTILTGIRSLTSSVDAYLSCLVPYLIAAHLECQSYKLGVALSGLELHESIARLHADIVRARDRARRRR